MHIQALFTLNKFEDQTLFDLKRQKSGIKPFGTGIAINKAETF